MVRPHHADDIHPRNLPVIHSEPARSRLYATRAPQAHSDCYCTVPSPAPAAGLIVAQTSSPAAARLTRRLAAACMLGACYTGPPIMPQHSPRPAPAPCPLPLLLVDCDASLFPSHPPAIILSP